MDMSSTSPVSPYADYAGPPPVLLAASSSEGRARASATIEAAGYRVAAVAIEEAVGRLAIQAAASAMWIELDSDCGAPLDRLLDRVEAEAASGRFPATRRGEGARVHDVASEPNAVRLRQLSDEVSRIAATLSRLSGGPGAPAANRNEPAPLSGEIPAVAIDTVRQVIRTRRSAGRAASWI